MEKGNNLPSTMDTTSEVVSLQDTLIDFDEAP